MKSDGRVFKYIKYYVDNNFPRVAVSRKLYIVVEVLLKFFEAGSEEGGERVGFKHIRGAFQ